MNDGGPRSRTRWCGAVATLAVIAVLATGCHQLQAGDSASEGRTNGTLQRANQGLVESTGEASIGGKLVYGLTSETNGWNPGTNQWANSGLEVAQAIFDTLSAFDVNSQIQPNLAEAFDHNADYTQWKIRLRPGIQLHNGKPVTSETVVRNQTYLKQSGITGGAYTYVKGFSAQDELTVVVDLVEPWVTYPMSMATQVGVVADPDWLETKDNLHPIGTGPFVFDQWQVGNKLTVKRNANYWRRDAGGVAYPYLDSVEFRVITDFSSRSAALRANDVDIIQTTSGAQIQDFQASNDFQILSDPRGESDEQFVMLNTQAPPFDDIDARRALAYATDKQAVIDAMTNGFNEPADGPYAPSSTWYVDAGYPQFDQAKARDLVAQVKARHNGQFSFTLAGVATPELATGQQLLQQQWAAVGIDATISTQEQTAMIVQVVSGNYQAVNWQQFGAPAPTMEGAWWSPELATAPPSFSLNFSRIKDEQIGVAQKQERAATDDKVRHDAVALLQKRLAADVPFVWLFHQKIGVIASPRVVNVANYTLPDGDKGLDLDEGAHPLYQIYLR